MANSIDKWKGVSIEALERLMEHLAASKQHVPRGEEDWTPSYVLTQLGIEPELLDFESIPQPPSEEAN